MPQNKKDGLKEKVKSKGIRSEPQKSNTEAKCLTICENSKFLKNPQYGVEYVKKKWLVKYVAATPKIQRRITHSTEFISMIAVY